LIRFAFNLGAKHLLIAGILIWLVFPRRCGRWFGRL
jgi:hypothetical protein